MGLDTSHDCWHGSYGGFMQWRSTIALAAGYEVASGRYQLPWDMFEDKNYQGEWDTVPGDDPLLYLLVHSDCDGVIHPAQGAHIAARLEQLLPLLVDDWNVQRTQRFIDGLRMAADAGEDVDFR